MCYNKILSHIDIFVYLFKTFIYCIETMHIYYKFTRKKVDVVH